MHGARCRRMRVFTRLDVFIVDALHVDLFELCAIIDILIGMGGCLVSVVTGITPRELNVLPRLRTQSFSRGMQCIEPLIQFEQRCYSVGGGDRK